MSNYVKVEDSESFLPGKVKCVFAGDRRIAVFNDGGALRAIDNVCTHVGGPLSEGPCEDGIVTCPWHGAQFRLSDGQVLRAPAGRSVQTYSTRVTDGVIEVGVEEG